MNQVLDYIKKTHSIRFKIFYIVTSIRNYRNMRGYAKIDEALEM
jgi:hypothetical protein